MRLYIILLIFSLSSTAFSQNSFEVSGSLSQNGTIQIGSSSTDIKLNKLSGNFQFHKNFSATLSKFWNASTVEIYNLSLNYEYQYNFNSHLSLEPNIGVGISYYFESTPIQPNISTPGLSLSPRLKMGIKLNNNVKVLPMVYYNFFSFSQGIFQNQRDNDIIVDQLGIALGVEYSW